MAVIVNGSFMVCGDCLPVIVNGDYSHLDYHYSEEEAEEKMKEIDQGIAAAVEGGRWISSGDTNEDVEFSRSPCHCCGDRLAGSRYHFVIMQSDK